MASSNGSSANRLKVDDTSSYLVESANLVTEQDWEKEEDRVGYEVMTRVVKRKWDIHLLSPEQLDERHRADRARKHNRECVRGWRDRYALHSTINHLDRMTKMNQKNATITKKLLKIIKK